MFEFCFLVVFFSIFLFYFIFYSISFSFFFNFISDRFWVLWNKKVSFSEFLLILVGINRIYILTYLTSKSEVNSYKHAIGAGLGGKTLFAKYILSFSYWSELLLLICMFTCMYIYIYIYIYIYCRYLHAYKHT